MRDMARCMSEKKYVTSLGVLISLLSRMQGLGPSWDEVRTYQEQKNRVTSEVSMP